MTDLTEQQCQACEGGVEPMNATEVDEQIAQIPSWQPNESKTTISKPFQFKNFYRTMSFVNAVAWLANKEGHHPDMQIGYNYCHITFMTHAIKGLSMNDFICAAKIEKLINL